MGKIYLSQKVSRLDNIWSNFKKIMKWINGQPYYEFRDISDTATIVGFSSFTDKSVLFTRIGNEVKIFVSLIGISNSSALTILLPDHLIGHSAIPKQWEETKIVNNGSAAVGYMILEAGSNTLRGYRTFSEANWTNSGSKELIGTGTFLIQ